jgi:hypothetical protein
MKKHNWISERHCSDCAREFRRSVKHFGEFPVGKMINEIGEMEDANAGNPPLPAPLQLPDAVRKHLQQKKGDAFVDDLNKIKKNKSIIGWVGATKVVIGHREIKASDPKFFDILDDLIR